MTAWQALTDKMCPSWLAQYLNRLYNLHPPFSGDYIMDLEDNCPYDTATDQAQCRKCWLDFLRGEVK